MYLKSLRTIEVKSWDILIWLLLKVTRVAPYFIVLALRIEIYNEVKVVEDAFRIMNPDVVVSESKEKAIIDDVTINRHPEVIAMIVSALPGI
jgi:hypothetical protein